MVDLVCDGVDDDCDEVTDEDFVSSDIQCGTGVCRADGSRQCVGGQIVETCGRRAHKFLRYLRWTRQRL